MQILSKFMVNNTSKDTFISQISTIVYRIISFFFYLRTYTNSPAKSDDYLATIVFYFVL